MTERLLDKRWPWLLAAGVVIIGFLASFVEVRFGPPPDPRPEGSAEDILALQQRDDVNVLFILIDTLRADRLGAYGYERPTSPTLDSLAASGVRFERHLAQSSWTKASMASLWTGMLPKRIDVTRFDDMLPDGARMPAEVLRDAGFYTAGLYRNGWVAPTFGFEQGFDVYTRPNARPLPANMVAGNPTIGREESDEDAIAAAIEFLRVRGHERWFLYVHLMDVHEYMYDESSALFGNAYSDNYDNAIHWTDSVIDVLLQHLDAEGLADETLVVVASDHGEAFHERGLEGHARKVYRESTEVPFLLSFPFRLPEPVVVSSRSRNVDIWPTLLELLGLPEAEAADGRSLVPEIVAAARGETPPGEERLGYAHLDMHWGQREREPLTTVAVTDGPVRYVVEETLQGRRVERLFDAAVDSAELKDVSKQQPETLSRMRSLAEDYLATEPHFGEAPSRELSELELNQLRALGYAIP